MMRNGLLVGLAAVVATALTGCALRDPYHRSGGQSPLPPTLPLPSALGPAPQAPTAAQASTATPTTPAPSSRFAPSAAMGPPASARHVIYQFALAYGDFSAVGAAARTRTLVSLSTPVFAQTFQAPPGRQELEASHALPAGAHMVARVTSIELSPAQGVYEHAVVIVQQALQQAGGTTEQPFATTFEADVLRIGSDWRVAAFTPQP